jgi:hypothetical protein
MASIPQNVSATWLESTSSRSEFVFSVRTILKKCQLSLSRAAQQEYHHGEANNQHGTSGAGVIRQFKSMAKFVPGLKVSSQPDEFNGFKPTCSNPEGGAIGLAHPHF